MIYQFQRNLLTMPKIPLFGQKKFNSKIIGHLVLYKVLSGAKQVILKYFVGIWIEQSCISIDWRVLIHFRESSKDSKTWVR